MQARILGEGLKKSFPSSIFFWGVGSAQSQWLRKVNAQRMGSDYVPIKTMPKSQLAQDGQADTRHSPLSATSHSRSSALLLGTFLHSSGMLMATAYSWKKQKTKQKNLASLFIFIFLFIYLSIFLQCNLRCLFMLL